MKKSSPKNLSADCRSTVGRLLTDSLPTVYRQITNRLPTSYRHLTDTSPTVGRLSRFGENLSAVCRSTVGRQTAKKRPTVGRQTANRRPTIDQQSADRFFGELFFTITKRWKCIAISGAYCTYLTSLLLLNVVGFTIHDALKLTSFGMPELLFGSL